MSKYYTLAINGLTPDQEKQLADRWRSYGWWHAIPDFWMLKDVGGQTTAASLRDEVRQIAPSARIMVIEVTPITWAATSTNNANREWLKKFWPPEGKS